MLSTCFTIYRILAIMEKNRQNKKIHAEIVATEASENQMFLHIFFMPSFMQYQNVLIFTVRSTLSLVTYQTSLVQGDDTFAHLVYHFLTVGYDHNRSAKRVDPFQ